MIIDTYVIKTSHVEPRKFTIDKIHPVSITLSYIVMVETKSLPVYRARVIPRLFRDDLTVYDYEANYEVYRVTLSTGESILTISNPLGRDNE